MSSGSTMKPSTDAARCGSTEDATFSANSTPPVKYSREADVSGTEVPSYPLANRTATQYEKLWEPDSSNIDKLMIEKFRRHIEIKFRLNLETYEDLYRWSVTEFLDFWEEIWEFIEPVVSEEHKIVMTPGAQMDEIPRWFLGCKLNFAENLLKYRDDRPALVSLTEGQKKPIVLTFAQLYEQVYDIASALEAHGLKRGDRVAGYMPNCSDTVAIMLAVTSLGGVWSSASPEFGVEGMLSRLTQVAPRFLFSVECVRYNGKTHSNQEKIEAIAAGLSSVEKVIIVPFLKCSSEIDASRIEKAVFMQDFLNGVDRIANADANGLSDRDRDGVSGGEPSKRHIRFEQVPFDHPLYIMFSSGTTGKPKCIVHSVGGTLIQHLKELKLHFDIGREDVLLYYTATGWMMWNWEVSALALGCPIVCYDGSPFSPHDNVVWDMVDSLGISVLGVSPKMLTMMEDKNLTPRSTHQLSSLRAILSTGAPLNPRSFDYVYRRVKSDVLLSSITGGTDIISLFGAGCVSLPVYRGLVQCRGLGMAVECFDESGKAVRNQAGELVCTRPFPSMPTGFWNDPNGEKYRKAYFDVYPHVWAHGDYCMITSGHNPPGIVMMGRSDGTLNPGGVRYGSSEIYSIVENFPEVEDSLCIAQVNSLGEERAVLFLKLGSEERFSKELVSKIQGAIRYNLSARHVPAVILEVPDIPYTLNGKKVEVAVKKVISGLPLDSESTGGLADPATLEYFRGIPELQLWLNKPLQTDLS